ncbi:hypothetical protein [Oleiagrimonas soli]|uniref:Uncharacterized protein n=1 Tax=Oleiagrimonas soli TaxID=1543381 RepID=A0A841KHV5_9GAMM|nr:hypothetical protein [Oleiagrimonas soli]MBB6184756.1 hypothetical protein [Oleiagrimonas soli]
MQRFHSSFGYCIRWGVKQGCLIVVLLAVVTWVMRMMGGESVSLSMHDVLTGAAVAVAFGVVLGSFVFLFGWMGRVTVTSEGIQAPRYSGFHDFVAWWDIGRVGSGNLSGWPCTIIQRKSGNASVYLMVSGDRRRALAEAIASAAPPSNPLAEYFRKSASNGSPAHTR